MYKSILVLFPFLFLFTLCEGQALKIDTLKVINVISNIDSLEHKRPTFKTFVVRINMHNETTVKYEFLVDTATQHIYKCTYVRLEEDTNDTLMDRSSFYINDGNFVAVKFQRYQNSQETFTQLNYLDTQDGVVKSLLPKPYLKFFTIDDVKYQAKALYQGIESMKDYLRKKNGS